MTLQAGRLSADEIADNFADLHPPLTPHEGAGRGGPMLFLP